MRRFMQEVDAGRIGGLTDAAAHAHLLMGLYSLAFLDHVPTFAAVSEAVEAVRLTRGRTMAGFANGALRAAEWVVKQSPGLYDMQDVLGLK